MILVIGATGKVGRQLLGELTDAGVRVRAVVRNPKTAGLPSGVEVVGGDLSASNALDDHLDGIDAAFLIWPLPTTNAAPHVVGALARQVPRIVYLSTLAVRDDVVEQTHPLSAMHATVESLIQQSGAGWTILRASKFATNTLAWVPLIRSEGVVELTYGAARRSPIHQRDIAAVAALTLTEEGHTTAKYVLTGSKSLTEFEQVRIVGKAIGRPLLVREIAPQAARDQMLAEGSSPELADAALGYWARLVTHPEPVTTTVRDLTGSPARTFDEWAIEHVHQFR